VFQQVKRDRRERAGLLEPVPYKTESPCTALSEDIDSAQARRPDMYRLGGHLVRTGSRAHPVLYTLRIRENFLEVRRLGHEAHHSLPCIAEKDERLLKNSLKDRKVKLSL
jgi:hypothetical protein